MQSLAYTVMNQSNTACHRCLHSYVLFGHCDTYLHVNDLAGQFLKIIRNEIAYQSDEIPLDIGFS